jgi:hypothetical protein|tara:strand:- start:94 stop:450 length:357 start_codon:yes stop_codon:yes gene_type:complete
MKTYSNSTRKPMMGGGYASPPKRQKKMSGGPATLPAGAEQVNPRGPTTVASMQGASKKDEDRQRMEELKQMYEQLKDKPKDVDRMKAMAAENTKEGMMMRVILQRAGEIDYPMGDKEQ